MRDRVKRDFNVDRVAAMVITADSQVGWVESVSKLCSTSDHPMEDYQHGRVSGRAVGAPS